MKDEFKINGDDIFSSSLFKGGRVSHLIRLRMKGPTVRTISSTANMIMMMLKTRTLELALEELDVEVHFLCMSSDIAAVVTRRLPAMSPMIASFSLSNGFSLELSRPSIFVAM